MDQKKIQRSENILLSLKKLIKSDKMEERRILGGIIVPDKKSSLTTLVVNGVEKETKACSKCAVIKPLEDYHLAPKGLGARSAVCKVCYRTWYEKNKGNILQRTKRNYQNNKTAKLEYTKRYKATNREKVKEYDRKAAKKYYHLNKDKRNANVYLWKKLNPEKWKRLTIRWRSYGKSLPVNLSQTDYNDLLESKCRLTGLSDNVQIDHFIALSTGHGGNYIGNLILLHAPLNSSKCDKNPFEWLKTCEESLRQKFHDLVWDLSIINGLTQEEYKNFVYWCYNNRRTVDEIKQDARYSIEIWRNDMGIHMPLPNYTGKR